MRTRLFLHGRIVLAVAVGLLACSKEEINQAMNRPAEIIQSSSPCPPADVSSSTPEVCVILTELRLLRGDIEADVSLTLVNRTTRRLFLSLSTSPYLTDSNGTRWDRKSLNGIGFVSPGNVPVPIEPNGQTQVSILFSHTGQAPSDTTTFSMRGEIAVMKVDTRGQASPLHVSVKRGFNLSGIHITQPSQSSDTSQDPTAAGLAQMQPTIPKVSASKSSARETVGETSNPRIQRNREATHFEQNIQLLATSGTGLAGSLKSSPDVLGIKVGVSKVADARGALGKVTPSLSVQEQYAQLSGQSSAGRAISQWVNVEDSKYLSQFIGTTQAYKNVGQACNADGITGNATLALKGNCEQIKVGFSGPPNAGIALHLLRDINFVMGPSFESVTRNLIEKYGEPGFHGVFGDRGVSHHFAWAWSLEGTPVHLEAQHPCTVLDGTGVGDITKSQENSKAKLQAGCAVALHAHLRQDNNVVKFLTIVAVDDLDIYNAGLKTSAFVDDYVKTFEKKEREKAATVAAPKF